MNSQIWGFGVLISSILLIVISIIKFKLHPFLALLLSGFYVGALLVIKP